MGSQEALGAGEKYVPPFDEIHEISSKSSSMSDQNSSIAGDGPDLAIEIPGNPILINQSVSEYLHHQLSVEILNSIHEHLYRAASLIIRRNNQPQPDLIRGLVHPPETIRPLHQQVVMLRTITITEDPCLHLTWTPSVIYIKPLPLYLLRWKFFDEHICRENELYGYATGFLLTYVSLVRSRSDFRIALEKGLIPEVTTWAAWSSLATVLASNPPYVNKRYQYGELRLGRINLTFLFQGTGNMPYTFWSRDDRWYSRFFRIWVLIFAYFSVALSALQVVLATNSDLPAAAKNASYGFGIFTLMSVLVSIGIFVGWVFIARTTHYIVQLKNNF